MSSIGTAPAPPAGRPDPVTLPRYPMALLSSRRALLACALMCLVRPGLQAQTVASARAASVAASSRAAPAWTLKMKGDIRWQQITPSGTLLVSTDGALTGVDIDRGQVVWDKPELGGLPPDSVHMVPGSILMEAARPGLVVVFDPGT